MNQPGSVSHPPQVLFDAPFLRELGPDERRLMVEGAQRKALERDQMLFRAGDPAEAFYVVTSGRIKLVRHTSQGKEMMLHLVEPGQSFADAAILGDGTYPATSIALEPSEVWGWKRSGLLSMFGRSPELALGFALSISIWTRRLAMQLELLTQRRVEERLAIYLQGRAGARALTAGDEIPLQEPRHLIAAQLGTGPEVLSRTFRRLEEQGVIAADGQSVKILDVVGFAALAEPIGS
jgi:CRP/FNR family transcriptional regulator